MDPPYKKAVTAGAANVDPLRSSDVQLSPEMRPDELQRGGLSMRQPSHGDRDRHRSCLRAPGEREQRGEKDARGP
jgi:hypothetical protein